MADFERMESYLREVEEHYRHLAEDPSEMTALDEGITRSLANLRASGLNTEDPEAVFHYVLGVETAYTQGFASIQQRCTKPVCAASFMQHHGEAHGDIAVVVRTLLRNLGVDLPGPA